MYTRGWRVAPPPRPPDGDTARRRAGSEPPSMRLSPGGSPAGALAPGGPRRLEAHGQPRLSTRWRGSSAGAAVLRMTTAADRAGRPLQASRKADLPSRRTSATPCPACLLSRSAVGAPSAGLAPTVSTMTALPRTRPTPPAPCSSTAPRRRWPATGRTITRCKRRIRLAARGRGERSIPSPAPNVRTLGRLAPDT